MSSAKQVRQEQNNACIGGLRNPNRAVAQSPRLRDMGSKLRRVLEAAMRQPTVARDAMEAVSNIGNKDYKGLPMDTLITVRTMVMEQFGQVYNHEKMQGDTKR